MQRKCRGHPFLSSKQTIIFCNDPHSELEFYKECKLIESQEHTVNQKDLCDLLTINSKKIGMDTILVLGNFILQVCTALTFSFLFPRLLPH